MMKSKTSLFFSLLVLLCSQTNAQSYLKKEAVKLLSHAKYQDVVAVVNNLKKGEEDGEALLMRGISYYFLNKPILSLNDLSKAHNVGNVNPNIYLYSAKSHYALGDYQQAALFYKNYLKNIDSNDKNVPYIIDEIRRCASNMELQTDLSMAYVENLGTSVNTTYDEISPKHSPNHQNKYYFSSDRDLSTGGLRNEEGLKDDQYGSYTLDMYAVELVNGNWNPVYSFNSLQNTAKNEVIQGFNNEGNALYFLKYNGQNTSVLYADSFNLELEKRAFPKEVVCGFDGSIGDKDLYIFNDSIWLFASQRIGGYGGYDLYSMRKKDGNWEAPVNMGPTVNSKFNEVSPFLSKGTRVLLFSSDRHEGFGGYDVFVSGYSSESTKWEEARNLGAPVNTPKNELGFFVSADGSQAVFSSDRIDGYGGYDIYIAYLKTQMLDQLDFVEIPMWMDTLASSLVVSDDPFGDVGVVKQAEDKVETPPAELREYLNQPILFSENGDVISPAGKYSLNNLADLMKIYPKINIALMSSTSTVGMADFNLFYTVKRGEKVIEYLVAKGINKKRIAIIGKGDNFPLVIPTETRIASTINNRVDIKVYDYDAKLVRVFDDPPTVLSTLVDERSKKWTKSFGTLVYAIKVGETSQMLRTDLIKTSKETFILKTPEKDSFEYFVGLFESYNEARALKNDLLRQGILNAAVVPFIYGRKLEDGQVNDQITAFPDLEDYLKYEK